MKHDDDFHDGRDHRGSSPFGAGRRSRGRTSAMDALFERFLGDVISWFDDEREQGAPRRRPGARRYRHDARPGDDVEEFADTVAGGAPPRRAAPASADGPAEGAENARNADSAAPSPSMRGRGPKNYRRSEERLGELVNDALLDDDRLDATDIEVSVSNGEVVLSGRVASRADKHRAEDLAAYVSGVDDVENRLRVHRPESKASTHPGGLPGDAKRDADDYGHP